MSGTGTALVWFRRDLRLDDNPALSAAVEQCQHVIPLYIHAPEEEAPWTPGAASRWWLHHSLNALRDSLRDNGSDLLILRGPSQERLLDKARRSGATHLFWNRCHEPTMIERDREIERELGDAGLACHSFNGNLLNEPGTILTGQGTPYRVFTAYWKSAGRRLWELSPPSPPPSRLDTPPSPAPGLHPDELELLPVIPWHKGFTAVWEPGESGAWNRWSNFVGEGLERYESQRDFPGIEGTSRLSAHLHFGEISPRRMLWEIRQRMDREPTLSRHLECYLGQVGWREFAHYTLFHFPHSADRSLDSRFSDAAWKAGDHQAEQLQRWQRGETGIPIVDAGMRQLWQTGWMHNRVRMIVASFLTKNLGIHWREGARWFWDTLVDADLANNSLGWQWTAGCGVDAAPYFRVFNPARQADRFNAGGYIQRWLPELKGADKAVLHNGRLDTDGPMDYRPPIVDLNQSRRDALQRWERIKRQERA
ncbi:cryptochrome/photolyase family protein [Sedimenticola sp.]|uniref:cryptochrome/photolyase family protein n=1 Tax=Sedimenticola sp. TaxID=1940285 RepID=UPI00259070FD|nr:deoxyribodipyrimidine photo-lyase [Sedimenticola sp.]MCW8902340.1 DNA photolyase family protein [Sedimenticola sp.]